MRQSETLIVFDAHSDIPTDVFIRRNNGEKKVLDKFHAPRLRKGGVNFQVMAIYVEARYKPFKSLEIALRQTEALLQDLSESSEFLFIKNKGDLTKAITQGKIGTIIDMEGAEPIEAGIELLHMFYRLGVRILGFTWNQRNALADGIGEIASRGGLTLYGKEVLREALKLNIIIDVSHLAPAGVDDILKLATGPIIASHSGAKSVYNQPRNLSDEHIAKIAKTGGIIGVPMFPTIVGPPVTSVETVIDHTSRLVEVAGKEHVGFGADFVDHFSDLVKKGQMGPEWLVKKGEEIQGLYSAAELPNFSDAMYRRGFDAETINGVLGINFYKFFEKCLLCEQHT